MEDPHAEHGLRSVQAESQGLGGISLARRSSNEGRTVQSRTRRGTPEFSELVLACRHRLVLLVFAGAVVSSALVALSWRLTDAPYEAKSLVGVRQHQEVIFTPQTSRADDLAFIGAQEQLVRSPQVLAAALDDEQVRALLEEIPTHNAIEWLRDLLSVEIQAGAEILHISVQHPSAQASQALCNAVTRAYLAEITNRATSDRQRRCEELERATRKADHQLDELWIELTRVASAVGSDNSQSLTIRDEIQLQAYREYAQQLRRGQLRGNELQSQVTETQLRMAADDKACDAAIDERLRNQPDVVAARDQLATIDARIEQMREVAARDDSPKLKQLYEDREPLVAAVEKVMNDLRPQLREQLLEQHRIEMESRLLQLRKELELNQGEQEFLHGRMEEIDTTIVRTDAKNGIQLEMARHAVDRQTRLADALVQSLEEFKIESQIQPRVKLIEWAQLPRKANHARQLKAGASAAGVGWLIVILCVGSLEWRGCWVRSSDDVRSHFARPVFETHGDSVGLFRVRSRCSASGAREAAARLMLPDSSSKTVPSVMVSSAVASEPRHLVALDLARAFTAFQRRTLLIDCDPSGTSLSRTLGATQLPGLIQISPHQLEPRRYIVSSSEEGLDFLPLGLRQGTGAWVDPQTLDLVLKSLRFDYHAIVLNGPAIMSSPESLLLASHVDQMLLAVFVGTSRWHQLAASEEFAEQAGIPVFASIVHSGRRSAALTLTFDRRRASRPVSEQEEVTEETLRAGVAAIQQELNRSTSGDRQRPAKSGANKEITS